MFNRTKLIFILSHLVVGMFVYLCFASTFASRDQLEIIRGIIITPLLLMVVAWLVSFQITSNLKFTIATVCLSSFLWVMALGYFIESTSTTRPFWLDLILTVKFAALAMFFSSPVLIIGAGVQFWLIKVLQKRIGKTGGVN